MINVMIVEDDPMVREINERFLQKLEGYSLLASIGTIVEAEKLIEQIKPNLILLDMFFANGRGIDLLKWIRQNEYNIDVIIISADKDKNTIRESLRYGVVDYLIKPFAFSRFKESLEDYKVRNKKFIDDVIEQETIDLITFKTKEQTDAKEESYIGSSMKGFNKNTFEIVLNGIEQFHGASFTADDLAKEIGVSRITARRYLDYLEGKDELILELEYGKIGRPKNLYRKKI